MRVTADDMVAAYRLTRRRAPWRVALPWSLAAVAIPLLFVSPPAMQPWWIGAFSLIVAGECTRFAVDRLWAPVKLAREHDQNRALQEPIAVDVTSDGLDLASSNTRSHLPWSHVRRWHEGPRHLVLMQTDALCIVLPKRDLDAAQLDVLRERLLVQVGPSGRTRR